MSRASVSPQQKSPSIPVTIIDLTESSDEEEVEGAGSDVSNAATTAYMSGDDMNKQESGGLVDGVASVSLQAESNLSPTISTLIEPRISVTFGSQNRQSTSSTAHASTAQSNQLQQSQPRNAHSGIKNVARKTVRGSVVASRSEQIRPPITPAALSSYGNAASDLSSVPGVPNSSRESPSRESNVPSSPEAPVTSNYPILPVAPTTSKKQKCLKCFKHFVHFKRHLKNSQRCAAAYASIPTSATNRTPIVTTAPREPAVRSGVAPSQLPTVVQSTVVQSTVALREPECIRNRQCRWCGGVNEFFSTVRDTKRHYKQCHPNTCIECGMKCRDEKERSLHERDEHQLQYSLDDEIEPHPAVLSVPTSTNSAPSARPLSQSPSFNLPSSMEDLVESTAMLDSENVPPSSIPPVPRLSATVLPSPVRIETVPCKQSIEVKKCNILNKSLPAFKSTSLLNFPASMVNVESCESEEYVKVFSASVDTTTAICENHTTSYTSAQSNEPQILNAPVLDVATEFETEVLTELDPFEVKPKIAKVSAQPSRPKNSIRQKLLMFQASLLEKNEKGPEFERVESLQSCVDLPSKIMLGSSIVPQLPTPTVNAKSTEVGVSQKHEKGPQLKTIEMLEPCDIMPLSVTPKSSLFVEPLKHKAVVNEMPLIKVAKVKEPKTSSKEQSNVKGLEPKIVTEKSAVWTGKIPKISKVSEQRAAKTPEPKTAKSSAKVSQSLVTKASEPKTSTVQELSSPKLPQPEVKDLEPKVAKVLEPTAAIVPGHQAPNFVDSNDSNEKSAGKVPKVRLDISALRAAQKNLSVQKNVASSLVKVAVPLPTPESDKGVKASSMQGRARKTVPKKKQDNDGSSTSTVDSSSSSSHSDSQHKRKRMNETESSSAKKPADSKKFKLDSRVSEAAKTADPNTSEPINKIDSRSSEPVKTKDPRTSEPVKKIDSGISEPVKTKDPKASEPVRKPDSLISEPLEPKDPQTSEPVKKKAREAELEKPACQPPSSSSAEPNFSTLLQAPLSNTFSFEPKKRVQHARRETVTVSTSSQNKSNSDPSNQKTSPVKYFFSSSATESAKSFSEALQTQRGSSIPPPPKVAKRSSESSKQKSSDKESRTKQYHSTTSDDTVQVSQIAKHRQEHKSGSNEKQPRPASEKRNDVSNDISAAHRPSKETTTKPSRFSDRPPSAIGISINQTSDGSNSTGSKSGLSSSSNATNRSISMNASRSATGPSSQSVLARQTSDTSEIEGRRASSVASTASTDSGSNTSNASTRRSILESKSPFSSYGSPSKSTTSSSSRVHWGFLDSHPDSYSKSGTKFRWYWKVYNGTRSVGRWTKEMSRKDPRRASKMSQHSEHIRSREELFVPTTVTPTSPERNTGTPVQDEPLQRPDDSSTADGNVVNIPLDPSWDSVIDSVRQVLNSGALETTQTSHQTKTIPLNPILVRPPPPPPSLLNSITPDEILSATSPIEPISNNNSKKKSTTGSATPIAIPLTPPQKQTPASKTPSSSKPAKNFTTSDRKEVTSNSNACVSTALHLNIDATSRNKDAASSPSSQRFCLDSTSRPSPNSDASTKSSEGYSPSSRQSRSEINTLQGIRASKENRVSQKSTTTCHTKIPDTASNSSPAYGTSSSKMSVQSSISSQPVLLPGNGNANPSEGLCANSGSAVTISSNNGSRSEFSTDRGYGGFTAEGREESHCRTTAGDHERSSTSNSSVNAAKKRSDPRLAPASQDNAHSSARKRPFVDQNSSDSRPFPIRRRDSSDSVSSTNPRSPLLPTPERVSENLPESESNNPSNRGETTRDDRVPSPQYVDISDDDEDMPPPLKPVAQNNSYASHRKSSTNRELNNNCTSRSGNESNNLSEQTKRSSKRPARDGSEVLINISSDEENLDENDAQKVPSNPETSKHSISTSPENIEQITNSSRDQCLPASRPSENQNAVATQDLNVPQLSQKRTIERCNGIGFSVSVNNVQNPQKGTSTSSYDFRSEVNSVPSSRSISASASTSIAASSTQVPAINSESSTQKFTNNCKILPENCSICGKIYPDLEKHLSRAHSPTPSRTSTEDSVFCKGCNLHFEDKVKFLKHRQRYHSSTRTKFPCSFNSNCKEVFSRNGHYIDHMFYEHRYDKPPYPKLKSSEGKYRHRLSERD